jgi:hypothetical protein
MADAQASKVRGFVSASECPTDLTCLARVDPSTGRLMGHSYSPRGLQSRDDRRGDSYGIDFGLPSQ